MRKGFFSTIILCSILIAGGVKIVISGNIWGLPGSRAPGIFFIIAGLYFLISAIKKKSYLTEESKYLKCLNCGIVIDESTATNLICPKCGKNLESLDGFFERHPGFEEKKGNIRDVQGTSGTSINK